VSTADDTGLREFWDALHAIPSVLGAGEKRWHPYELHSAALAAAGRLEQPIAAYRELLAAERDPYWREVLLFLAGWSDDPAADDLLIDALDDPGLRPRALYLLGVAGTKGWPARERDAGRVAAALRRFAGDPATYTDIVHGTAVRVGDLATAAFARVVGPERLPAVQDLPDVQARWIGLALPEFPPHPSAELAAQVGATA
jgi:hypothetical protein